MLESVWERLRAFGCKQTEHILYWISIWCVLGVGLVYIAAFYIAHVTGNDRLLQCKMKLYFGIPCPGCGGTRAIWSLLHGRVLQALYYNAFAVYGAVWYLLFFISQTVQRVAARFDRQINGMKFRDAALYIAIVVLDRAIFVKAVCSGLSNIALKCNVETGCLGLWTSISRALCHTM